MHFRKLFWIDFGIEWGLGGIVAFVLAFIGRPDLIPQTLGVIIGLHFLPLAKIAAIGSFIIPRSDVRSIAGCTAIGLILWLTGLVILRRITWQSKRLVNSEI